MDSENVELIPQEVVKSVLKDYVTMNKCALIYTALVQFLEQMAPEVTISVDDIKAKLREFEVTANEKLQHFTNILNS